MKNLLLVFSLILVSVLFVSCENPAGASAGTGDTTGTVTVTGGSYELTFSYADGEDKKPVLKINPRLFDSSSVEITPRRSIKSVRAWVFVPSALSGIVTGGKAYAKFGTAYTAQDGDPNWVNYTAGSWTEVTTNFVTVMDPAGLADGTEAVIQFYGASGAANSNGKVYIDDVLITFGDDTTLAYNFNDASITDEWRLTAATDTYAGSTPVGTVTGARSATVFR